MNVKDLLFKVYSVDGKLDYISMLFGLCKDDYSITGLMKAISLVYDQNITVEKPDESRCMNDEQRSIRLPMEKLYKTLIVCLKNYMVIIIFIVISNEIV